MYTLYVHACMHEVETGVAVIWLGFAASSVQNKSDFFYTFLIVIYFERGARISLASLFFLRQRISFVTAFRFCLSRLNTTDLIFIYDFQYFPTRSSVRSLLMFLRSCVL